MKFKQISTGTVLETENEEVIKIMTSSNAYVAVEQPKETEQPKEKAGKGSKDKTTEK